MDSDDIIFEQFKTDSYSKYGAIIIKLSDYKFVHRTIVEFKCKCSNILSLQYRIILKRGAYCRVCCNINSLNKRKETLNNLQNTSKLYNKLCSIENRDKCNILDKQSIIHTSIISLICSCGNNYSTAYRNIKLRGGFCRECSYSHGNIKRINTFKEKYNSTHPTNTPHIVEKIRNTNMERYNALHPAQSPLVNCNTYKAKEYITPTGKKYIIQGYENTALDELFTTYCDDDIIVGKNKVPKIDYIFDNKDKVYYPDIYIPKENKIIEVKSTWTYDVQKEKNTHKANACKILGYKYEFWIYDSKKNKNVLII